MLVGRVVGNVWATRKDPTLEGLRFLMVRPFTTASTESQDIVVAGDTLGAGIGETVLVAFGRAARTVLGSQDLGWQVAVVAIVDSLSLADGGVFELGDHGERIPVDGAALAADAATVRHAAGGAARDADADRDGDFMGGPPASSRRPATPRPELDP